MTGAQKQQGKRQTTRRGSRIEPAQTSAVPTLLDQLEAIDPRWEENTNDFVRSLLENIRGPTTGEVLRFPVVSPMGGLYQRQGLMRWLREKDTDPRSMVPIDREAIVRHVPQVAGLIEEILREALRDARARRDRDARQIHFQEQRVRARDHPAFGRFIRGGDSKGLVRALQRSDLTDQQKREVILGLDRPDTPVRVRRKQKKNEDGGAVGGFLDLSLIWKLLLNASRKRKN